jgi:DNA-binding NarL/FixJ family response regulator
LEVGAKGYVLKEEAAKDLVEAIRVVHQGNYYFSAEVAEIAEKYLAGKGNQSEIV